MSQLDYVRSGAGEPLLLVHGTASEHGIWEPMLPSLAEHHDVIAVDLPGFGASPTLDGPLSTLTLAAAVAETMDAVGWDDAHVVGQSLGGAIAMELAAAGRARSVVGISPGGQVSWAEGIYARAVIRLHRLIGQLLRPFIPRLSRSALARGMLMSAVGSRNWRWDPDLATRSARAFIDCLGLRATLAGNLYIPDDRLRSIGCPVLIAWGSLDALLPVWQAKRWARVLPHAEIRILQGLGHTPMPDEPDLLAGMILDFLVGAVSRK